MIAIRIIFSALNSYFKLTNFTSTIAQASERWREFNTTQQQNIIEEKTKA
jgi:hypothetical protein